MSIVYDHLYTILLHGGYDITSFLISKSKYVHINYLWTQS